MRGVLGLSRPWRAGEMTSRWLLPCELREFMYVWAKSIPSDPCILAAMGGVFLEHVMPDMVGNLLSLVFSHDERFRFGSVDDRI